MDKINFQDGTKVSSAKVTIDEVDYPVTPARYTGATPLSANVMNTMQDNIEDAIDQNVSNIGGEDYDETATYEEGDIVKYEGQLYICIEAIDTPEEWDSTKWNATDVLSSAGGNEVTIGTSADITGKTKIFIDESEGTDAYSEVVNSLSGNEIAKAPSVRAVNGASVIVSATEPTGNNRRKVWKQHSYNLFDGELELGTIFSSTGENNTNDNRKRSKNYIEVEPNTTYTLSFNSSATTIVFEYTSNKTFIGTQPSDWTAQPYTFTTTATTKYIRFISYNTSTTEAKIEQGSNVITDKEYILDNNIYIEFGDRVINYVPKITPLINVELNANAQQLIKNSKTGLVTMNLTFKAKGNIDLSGNTAIFSLPSDLRPSGNININVWSYSQNKFALGFYQNVSGNIMVKLGSSLSTNEEINMTGIFYAI